MQKSGHLQKTRIGDGSMSARSLPFRSVIHWEWYSAVVHRGSTESILPFRELIYQASPQNHLFREPLYTPSQVINKLSD